MKISVIGSGVVGRTTGIGLKKFGNEIMFYDIDVRKLLELEKRGFQIAKKIECAVNNSVISFICVPTPTSNGKIDLTYIKEAVTNVAKSLRKKGTYHVVVIRSTILPSYTRTKILPLLVQCSGLNPNKDFGLCVNPEFLREANAMQDFLHPSRIVIGELNERSGNVLEELYKPFKAPIFRTDLDTAEMIKYASNCFLSTKISYFNEIYLICKKLGLDPHIVSQIVALDPRIGNYGTRGGHPFGGKCLPKDLEAFISFIKQLGLNPKLLTSAQELNEEMRKMAENTRGDTDD